MVRRTDRQAFTLLELLLVVFIIGILAALVVGRFVGVQEKTKITVARGQISELEKALERYKINMDKYPTAEEGLNALVKGPDDPDLAKKWEGPYLGKAVPKDSWGKDYIYKCPGEHNATTFDLYSWGPDGQEGTEDDIKNWEDAA